MTNDVYPTTPSILLCTPPRPRFCCAPHHHSNCSVRRPRACSSVWHIIVCAHHMRVPVCRASWCAPALCLLVVRPPCGSCVAYHGVHLPFDCWLCACVAHHTYPVTAGCVRASHVMVCTNPVPATKQQLCRTSWCVPTMYLLAVYARRALAVSHVMICGNPCLQVVFIRRVRSCVAAMVCAHRCMCVCPVRRLRCKRCRGSTVSMCWV